MTEIDEVFRKPPHMLAGVADAETTPAEVAKALSEYQSLRERHTEEDASAVRFAAEIEQLERAELAAEASALRSGGKVPKSQLAAKRAELTERERAVAVLRVATADSFKALTEVVAEHREPWAAALAGEAQARRAVLVDAVEAVDHADRELRQALTATAWVASFPSQHPAKGAKVGEAGLKKPSGDAHQPAELVDGLRVYAAGGRPASTRALPVG